MSILILSLLLLLLVGIGALMGRRVSAMERFQNHTAKRSTMERFDNGDVPPPSGGGGLMSNAVPPTYGGGGGGLMTNTAPPQVTGTVNVDPLARDMAVQAAVVEGGKKHNNVVPNSPYPTPEAPSISPPGPIIIPPLVGPGGEPNSPIPHGPHPHVRPIHPRPHPHPAPPTPAPNPDPNPPTPAPNPTPYPPYPPTPNGGWCPACPDMSQYIRMDEIPCWNCTLP